MTESLVEHTYLSVPPEEEMRSCIGLVLAGMAARANIGVGNLEDAVDLLETFHSGEGPTRFRFTLRDEGVVAQVEEDAVNGAERGWRTVIELVS
ncbi:Hypothetical Protein RradSPS_1361 [Rubrobacter radiotolerans]|uniref:Uncharacterized protein n=1 Tax=Rubrobacter radiotolerans TaxID=42256 RepID=A0A023X3L7_RUBRA|nr:hypothetical protein [Rubrobacter radiotolerans]AHY46644.1 Hypothetical Protein RradSPS_1361 [Rubrobacter radiotolerans]MDX5894051.1 hypothetical protein [Rubrobacter radiotolerans]SMC05066.1 putative transcriptional regulator [Rubrobacter radiotolerans DSM 5868]